MHPIRLQQCVGVLSLFLLAACDTAPTRLRLALPSSELDADIATDLASVLNKGSAFQISLMTEPSAGEDALEMLAKGQVDLALVSNYLPYREGVATVTPVYPAVLHIGYKDGRDTSSGLRLLDGARVFAGVDGSASRLMFSRIARHIGLTQDDFSFVDDPDTSDTTVADIVAVFAPISQQHRESFTGYRLYSLGNPGDIGSGSVVDAATLLNPPLRPFVIPAGTYGPANTAPVVTVAVDKMLVARSDLSASVVYDLIYELRRARPALVATRPGLFDASEASFDVLRSTFVLHSGTQNFLHRNEPTIYERYSGVAEVVVTLVIALVSASFAAIRILRIRRKNRIDRFYSAALELRNKLDAASSDAERASARLALRKLQDEAFAQLVDEKLAADDSFRIFITLSNDILRQYSDDPN